LFDPGGSCLDVETFNVLKQNLFIGLGVREYHIRELVVVWELSELQRPGMEKTHDESNTR
jgi:hypothetical protein